MITNEMGPPGKKTPKNARKRKKIADSLLKSFEGDPCKSLSQALDVLYQLMGIRRSPRRGGPRREKKKFDHVGKKLTHISLERVVSWRGKDFPEHLRPMLGGRGDGILSYGQGLASSTTMNKSDLGPKKEKPREDLPERKKQCHKVAGRGVIGGEDGRLTTNLRKKVFYKGSTIFPLLWKTIFLEKRSKKRGDFSLTEGRPPQGGGKKQLIPKKGSLPECRCEKNDRQGG